MPTRFPHRRFVLHYGDLTDSSNLARILQQVHPDEVYNLGAQSHVAVSFESPEYTAYVRILGTTSALDVVAKDGYSIKLESFFLGSYFNGSRSIAWSIFDLADTSSALDSGNLVVTTGLTVTANLLSNKGFRIPFGPDAFNGGINLISYSTVAPVPLPAAAWLFNSALGGLALIGRPHGNEGHTTPRLSAAQEPSHSAMKRSPITRVTSRGQPPGGSNHRKV